MAEEYATVDDVMAWMPEEDWTSPSSDDDYYAIIETACTKASRLIDTYTRREAGAYARAAEATRYFTGSGTGRLRVDEMAAAPSAVAVAEGGLVDDAADTGGTYTTWLATDYLLWPSNALAKGKPLLQLRVNPLRGTKTIFHKYPKAVKITTKFGYSDTDNTPEPIKTAAIIQAVRLFMRGKQAWEDVGAIVALKQLRYVKELDPEVKNIVAEFKKGVRV